MKSELALFDPPMVQVTMEKSSWVDTHPIASLDGEGPIEFSIVGPQDEYLDLNDTALYVKFKIMKADGTRLAADNKPIIANLALASLFSDVSLTLSDTVVEGGHYLYPYKAMMSTVLQFSDNILETQMRAAGYQDTITSRQAWIVESRSVEVMGALQLDMFCQSRYLLPAVNVRVKLTRSKLDFFCQYDDKKGNIKLVIEDAILYIRKVKVTPSVLLGHEIGLEKTNAIYPIQQTDMVSYTIAKATTNHIQDNLFRGLLPKLVIIGMVSNEAFNGDRTKDPLKFQHFNINHLSLHRDGESVPYSQPMQMDFQNDLVIRPYLNMFQALELFNTNAGNGIYLSEFKDGKTLFVFNLTPDLNASGSCGQPYQTANMRLEMKFSKPLTDAINVIIMVVRDGRIDITKQRRVLKHC